MITEFYDVILVDFSGMLPFKLEKEDILTRQEMVATENLKNFLVDLEKSLQYEFLYIGADLLEGKLFHRVLMQHGLLELLIGTPITLIGHFKDKDRAENFRDSLKTTLNKLIPKQLQLMVDESIEIKKIKKEFSTADKQFSKLGGS